MKKGIKFTTVLIFSALLMCSCGKKEKSETSDKKNDKEISTNDTYNDAYVVAPDVIEYDEDGNVIEPTAPATDGQYIEINPFEGWNSCQFVRKADGEIMADDLSDWVTTDAYKILEKNDLAIEIVHYTLDGKCCSFGEVGSNTDYRSAVEGETVIAVLRNFAEQNPLDEEVIEKVKADAKEKGIILTEVTREMVVTITREEPTESPET